MLDSDEHSVEEDENNDEPVERLTLHQMAHSDSAAHIMITKSKRQKSISQ